jgi:cation diffusion facilitator CzcD-associated flavoprotein CzcO
MPTGAPENRPPIGAGRIGIQVANDGAKTARHVKVTVRFDPRLVEREPDRFEKDDAGMPTWRCKELAVIHPTERLDVTAFDFSFFPLADDTYWLEMSASLDDYPPIKQRLEFVTEAPPAHRRVYLKS